KGTVPCASATGRSSARRKAETPPRRQGCLPTGSCMISRPTAPRRRTWRRRSPKRSASWGNCGRRSSKPTRPRRRRTLRQNRSKDRMRDEDSALRDSNQRQEETEQEIAARVAAATKDKRKPDRRSQRTQRSLRPQPRKKMNRRKQRKQRADAASFSV